MASSIVLVWLGVATAFLGGSICIWLMACALGERLRASKMQQRVGSENYMHRKVRMGYPVFSPLAQRVLRAKVSRNRLVKYRHAFEAHGYFCTDESVCTLAIGWALVLFVGGSLVARSWVFGVATTGCALAVVEAFVSRDAEARRRQMHEALPDALRAMGVCFHAGYTLRQTFAQLKSECNGALGDVFAHVSQSIELGESAQTALAKMQGSDSIPELAFVSVALAVQHQTGGSMSHVLDSTCESLESELDVRRSLRVHTAQARLSARVVTGVTIALVAVLSLLSKDFLGPFFRSAAGVALLAVALTMQVAGVLVVRKMLHVEMD